VTTHRYREVPSRSSTTRGRAVPTIVWSSIASINPDITAASSSRRRAGEGATATEGRGVIHGSFDM
jgi:hypothetical protein